MFAFPILTAFLDRLGGWRYKWARRYLLPLAVFCVEPTVSRAVFSLSLGLVLTFDLDEIEDRRWEEVFLHGFAISACLWTITGWWSWMVWAWWVVGVYLSNLGLTHIDNVSGTRRPFWKLDWKWVEIGRGFLIGLACTLGGL